MQLAKSMLDRTGVIRFSLTAFSLFSLLIANSQDNSPYSRYGLGNQFATTNIINRGMGGVSAAYSEFYSVNYANPASYARFQTIQEALSKKMRYGRVVLDVGVNGTSRTLVPPNSPESFTSSDLFFSHVYVGLPIRKNWGLVFGIRPISRISYDVFRRDVMVDPSTGLPIDSAVTQFRGNGGTFLPSIGTGFGTGNFSLGINMGYLFGKKETVARRIPFNDSVAYASSNHTTLSSFGDLFFNAGMQYHVDINKDRLKFGLAGNWKQTIGGSQDIRRYTYSRNSSGGETIIDSVYDQTDVRGEMIYPSSITAGLIYERAPSERVRGWTLGFDYVNNNWDQFRFFGGVDSVQSNHEIRIGGELIPIGKPQRYGQAITYRAGFFTGRDYIRFKQDLPVFGFSLGMGLPVVNYSRLSQNQFTVVNLAFEYARRGNDENVLKENLYRFSVGFNLTDLWFGKRRYE